MTSNKPTDVLVKLVDLLTPLSSEERQRAVSAALMYLGEAATESLKDIRITDKLDDTLDGEMPARAKNWIKQNGLSIDAINEVFHITGGHAEIIASEIPGKSSREKTLHAYVLTGVAKLLATGSSSFDDKLARTNCKNLGCFNEANHSAYMASKGNEISGSKDKGWSLTAPGLKQGAWLVTEIASKRT